MKRIPRPAERTEIKIDMPSDVARRISRMANALELSSAAYCRLALTLMSGNADPTDLAIGRLADELGKPKVAKGGK